MKTIVASFFGTLLALAAVAAVAWFGARHFIDQSVQNISIRLEAQQANLQANIAERLNNMVVQATERLRQVPVAAAVPPTPAPAPIPAPQPEPAPVQPPTASGADIAELLKAFGTCIEDYQKQSQPPAEAVQRCMTDYAWATR